MEEAPPAPGSSVNETSDPQTSTTTNAPSLSKTGGGSTSGQIRARATVVCQECKRQKSKCDRKKPCGSCLKKKTVERCVYSADAAEKVDVHSLNTRTTEIEAILGAFCRGVPIDFTPTYPPAVEAMDQRIASYTAQGGVVNSTPRHDHHDPANANSQQFFLSGPVDIARSYGSALSEHAGEPIQGSCTCDGEGENGLRVKEEATSDQEDEDEVMLTSGSSAMSGVSQFTPTSSKAQGKRKIPRPTQASSAPLASSVGRQNSQAFLPAVGMYYSESMPSAPTAVVPGLPVSNPGPPTSFPGPESAPLFYTNNQDPTTSGLPPVASSPLVSPSTTSPMGPPPVPIRSPHESMSKPFVTLGLLGHLPNPDSGMQYLRNAKSALNCFVLDLGLPRNAGIGARRFGWNAIFRRYQKRLVQRGLSGVSFMAPATSEGVDHPSALRLEGKSNPGGSRKKVISSVDAPSTSSSNLNATSSDVTVGGRRLGQRRGASGAIPSSPSSSRSSPQLPVPVPALSKYQKSRLRDDVSIPSLDSSPPQNESLPYFALTAALMAVGASNIPSVRAHKTESITKFGTVNHSESPSFLFALSQQALGVWMDGGQPVPAGVKDDQASIKDMRADFLRACLVGVHYLMGTENVDSPNRFCAKCRKHDSPRRQAILSLLGKMVAALRSWGFAEGLLSSSTLSQVDDHSEPTSTPGTSSKNASSQQSKRGNGKSVKIQSTESNSSANGRDEESEDARSEGEESRIRVLWDVYYYDLVLSDGFGVESLIPASCYSSTPLPSHLPDFGSDTQHINKDANEDQGLSSKDQEKLKEETQRMRLEQTYLVHRASLTRVASTIKRGMPLSCCDHTLGQAVKMENSVMEWVDGVPSELRWAFKHGVESSASRLVATGKAALGDESDVLPRDVDFAPGNAGYQSRRRVLSCELALITQLLVLKIFSPFVSEHLTKGSPTPEPHSSVAIALRHIRASMQAIIHVSRLMHDVWEMAAQSERSTFHTPPSLKPPLLGIYPLDQLLLDTTLMCSRICCGFVPSEPGGEGLGMNRCDPCSSEIMLSIGMGLTLLEQLHGSSQRSHSIRNRNASLSTPHPPSVDMKLVKLVRKRWEAKNTSLASSELSKRDRATMEAEDREGEDGYVGSSEGVQPEVNMYQMEACSNFGEEVITTSEPQQDGGRAGVDQTQDPLCDSITTIANGAFGSAVISRARESPNPLATPSQLLASSLSTSSTRAKKGKGQGQKTQIRRRMERPTRPKAGPTKQPPNPPKPLYTSLPREFNDDGTLASAEAFQNESRMVERPRYSPATGMHPLSIPLTLSEVPKLEDDDGAMVDSNGLAHYTTSYNSTSTTMGPAQPQYQAHAIATPYIDTGYHHPQHSYAPAVPTTPIYRPPSHPESPSPANTNHFGQRLEPDPSASGYYVEQSMAGYSESTTGWVGSPECVQTQTHEQGYNMWLRQ